MFRIKRPLMLIGFVMLICTGVTLITGTMSLVIMFSISVSVCILLCVLKSEYAGHLLVTVICVCLCAFCVLRTDGNYKLALLFQSENQLISGKVLSFPDEHRNQNMSGFILGSCEINGSKVPGKIQVYTKEKHELVPGDVITLFAEEITENTSEGVFRFHTMSERMYLTAFSYSDIKIIEPHSEKSLYTAVIMLRKSVTQRMFSVMDESSAAIATALVTGDKSYLSDEMLSSLKSAGVSHIFAVSGMHLALWTGIFFIILKNRFKSKLIPNLAASLFVIFYVIFTGFSPSVLRAGIMLLSVFVAAMIRHRSDSLNALGLSAAILVFSEPCYAGNISFLLSFTATFTLIVFSDKVSVRLNKDYNKKKYFRRFIVYCINSILISFSVIFMTLPLTSLFFGYVSLVSPFVSLAVTPLAEIVMTGSVISCIFNGTGFFAKITECAGALTENIIRWAGNLSFATVSCDVRFVLPFFIFCVLLFAVIYKGFGKRKAAVRTILSLFLAVLVFSSAAEIVKSDEIYIKLPGKAEGKYIYVYTNSGHCAVYGGSDEYSCCRAAVESLNRQGILRADYLLWNSDASDKYIRKSILAENTVCINEKNKLSQYRGELWRGAEFYSVNSPGNSFAVFYLDGIKTVVCSEYDNITEPGEDFLYGDILICYGEMPSFVSVSYFPEIIIIQDSEKESNAVLKDDDIKITVKGESYAVYGRR